MSSGKETFDVGFDSDLDPIELRAAIDTTASFLVAVKSYSLFPPEHASTRKMLGGVSLQLANFMKKYGDFRLVVEKNRLLYCDEVVFEEEATDGNPAFIFFRDGIRWIEFQEGLQDSEVVTFFQLISYYKETSEERDGDIVTALWSADLAHMSYEASDDLWEAEPVLEFSLLNPAAQEFLERGGGAVKGFDLLKSMLGIEPLPSGGKGDGPDDDAGEGAGPGGDSGGVATETAGVTGAGIAAGPGGGPGGSGADGAGVAGAGTDSGTGRLSGLTTGPFDGSDAGSGEGEGAGGSGSSEDLSFWNTLTGAEPSVGFGSGTGGGFGEGSGAGEGSGPGKATGEDGGPGGPGAGSGGGHGAGEGSGLGAATGAGEDSVSPAGPGAGIGVETGVGTGAGTGNGSGEGRGTGAGGGSSAGSGKGFATVKRDGGVGSADGSGPGRGLGGGGSSARGSVNGSEPGEGKGQDTPKGSAKGHGGLRGLTLPSSGKIADGRGGGKYSKGGSEGSKGAGSPATPVEQKRASADSRPGQGGDWEDKRPTVDDDYISVSVASIEVGETLWSFSQEEKRTLDQMIKEYEEKSSSSDVTELLMFVLRDETEPHIFDSIISFMKEDFRNILITQDFRLAYALLNNLKDLREHLKEEKEWALPILDRYFDDIAEPEIIDTLMPVWSELQTFDEPKLKTFAALMQILPPKTGETLAPMFSRIISEQGRRIMVDMIAGFVRRDIKILEKMLGRPEEEITLRLIHILRGLPDHNVAEALLYKVIHHSKESVRKEVLSILVSRESQHYEKMFQMIHDSNQDIRMHLLDYFGDERRPVAESILQEYMRSDRFQGRDHEHLLACYRALGRCGSDKSVPFLEKILFNQPWNFVIGFGIPVHRQGAALALKLIKTPESIKLFNRAAKSSIPHIKGAWLKADADKKQ